MRSIASDSQLTTALNREEAAQRRIAQLALAESALERTLSLFTANVSMAEVARLQLKTVAEFFGSTMASFWSIDLQVGTTTLILSLEDGVVVDARGSQLPLEAKELGVDAADVVYRRTCAGLPYQLPVAAYLDPAHTWYWPEMGRCLGARGFRSLLILPMRVAATTVGMQIYALADAEPLDEERTQLAMALANQSAFALHLGRLAESERERARAEERERIARDVHDGLAQTFTGIVMQLDSAELALHGDTERARSRIERSRGLARNGVLESRRLSAALTSRARAGVDFINALGAVVDTAAGTFESLALEVAGDPWPVEPDVAAQLVLIAREALSNAQRHARARAMRFTVRFGCEFAIEIEDDGEGFDAGAPRSAGSGMFNMRARAEHIGAAIAIESRSGSGTRISIVSESGRVRFGEG